MKLIFSTMLLAVVMSGQAQAGEVKVAWQEPEKFTDIRPGSEHRSDFQGRMIKEFDYIFADLAKKLPDGYQWDVTVTDVDLAGDVRPFFPTPMNEIRVIKDLYWPRMSFSFDLKDGQGKSVVSGNENLRDMNFLMHSNLAGRNNSFRYEEQMLRDWFKKQQRDKVFPER
ncbi:DUF3016 domain-containing protein [Undibacterium pigrum]|uniref:DUF3016 family protein n=1 Tax=Undibacterium pigrum TaxID=401470 RepID=A0A318IVY6_9BURK|nr:DUF3016 domain-containing protein [Undibacterium pigrum]PXX40366.1 hypothetical protein DFR42_108201 [Undibacterium pigrum]